jgi:hypothetical protein
MKVLQRAVDKGFHGVKHFQKNPELNPLRSRRLQEAVGSP